MNGHIITANDLPSGRIVYLREDRVWTRDISRAQIFTDIEVADRALLQTQACEDRVIEAYLVAVNEIANAASPHSARELIRAYGPTTYDSVASL